MLWLHHIWLCLFGKNHVQLCHGFSKKIHKSLTRKEIPQREKETFTEKCDSVRLIMLVFLSLFRRFKWMWMEGYYVLPLCDRSVVIWVAFGIVYYGNLDKFVLGGLLIDFVTVFWCLIQRRDLNLWPKELESSNSCRISF